MSGAEDAVQVAAEHSRPKGHTCSRLPVCRRTSRVRDSSPEDVSSPPLHATASTAQVYPASKGIAGLSAAAPGKASKGGSASARSLPSASWQDMAAFTASSASSAHARNVSASNHAPAAAASSASLAAASFPAAAAAAAPSSSSYSSASDAGGVVAPPRLFPHPNVASTSMYFGGRAGAGSSSTPRKRQLLEEQQHREAQQHNASYHSAAAGTPLTYTQHYSANLMPHSYVHFRRRFKPRGGSGSRSKVSRALQQELTQAATAPAFSSLAALAPPAGSNAAAALADRRKATANGSSSSAAAAASAGSKSAKGSKEKKEATLQPYVEIRAESLRAHVCKQPHTGGDWLWESLQHRTPYANVPLHDALLSPFAHPMPLHDSSIKPYFRLSECDEESLRLFTGLKPIVRYHRMRGLVVPYQQATSTGGKKGGQHGKGKEKEARYSPDAILEMLAELARKEKGKAAEDSDDDSMDLSDGPGSSRHARARRAASAPSRSSFLSLLRDPSLIPTSLNTPHHLFDHSTSPFFVVPLSMQLFLARFAAHMPPSWEKDVARMKKQHLALHLWPSTSGRIISSHSEEEWMSKNETILPVTHRKLVRLFYSHVHLPAKESGNAPPSAAAAAPSAVPPPPLHDAAYHLNTTSFCSALLYHLYQNKECQDNLQVHMDALANRVPSYYAHVVKCPLSLYDVDMRVACGYYDSPLEMLQDVWRCVENAMQFYARPWHARAGLKAKEREAAEERATLDGLSRDMAPKMKEVWGVVCTFVETHYVSFMAHAVAGCAVSPRCAPALVHSTLKQLRVWMAEVGGRDVQTLKLLWIKQREVEPRENEEEEEEEEAASSQGSDGGASASSSSSSIRSSKRLPFLPLRRAPQYVSQWPEYHAPTPLPVLPALSGSSSDSESVASAASASSPSPSPSPPPPRKRAKVDSKADKLDRAAAAAAAYARARQPMRAPSPPSFRAERRAPSRQENEVKLKEIDPHAPFPPPYHSRSYGGRYADNLPRALVQKLGRRGGKIPYSWDARWFLVAKLQ